MKKFVRKSWFNKVEFLDFCNTGQYLDIIENANGSSTTAFLKKVFNFYVEKKVALGKVDRSMKIFNSAYPPKSELIHRQH